MAAVLSLIYIVQVLVGDPWLLRRAGRARTAPLPVVPQQLRYVFCPESLRLFLRLKAPTTLGA